MPTTDEDGLEVVELLAADDLLVAAHLGAHVCVSLADGRWCREFGLGGASSVRVRPGTGVRWSVVQPVGSGSSSGPVAPGERRDVDGEGGRGPERLDAGEHERGDEALGIGLVAQVEPVGRRDGVGQDDPGGPLGDPPGLVRSHPTGEERRGEPGRGDQQAVRLVERQVAEDEAGLVLDQEVQGGMVPEAGRGLHDAADQGGAQVAGGAEPDAEGAEEAGHLGVHDRPEDLVPTAGERPVDGGPRDARLPGDVVHRGLGGSVPGEAGQGAVDDALPMGRRVRDRGCSRGQGRRSAGIVDRQGHHGARVDDMETPSCTYHL